MIIAIPSFYRSPPLTFIVMNFIKILPYILIFLMFINISGCINTNVEETLSDGLNTIHINDSVLIYERFFSTGGTDCWGSFLDRWYGTNQKENNLERVFEDKLSESGWKKEGRFWYLDSLEDNARIRLSISTYAPHDIDLYQSLSFTVPLTNVQEMQKFDTVYLFSSYYFPENGCGARR